MEVTTKNSTEKSLEKVSAGKPISVYSASFTNVISKLPGKRSISNPQTAAPNSFSKKVFRWRNVAAIAAILGIGVLHFAFQMSVIRTEITENRPLTEVPAVKVEPVRAAPAETVPAENNIKRIDAELPARPARAARAPLRSEPSAAAPSKPQSKKREAVESRAARLRRAERILTGV